VEEKHLEDAAALVVRRYRALRQCMPLLPDRYEAVDAIYPLLEGLTSSAPGMVALRDGKLAGFLAAWMTPSWRGQATTYSPEWGNAAELDDARRIYQALYTELAAFWVAQNYSVHTLTLFANEQQGIEGCQWLGFGYSGVDARVA
jgi:hypothetical protein